MKSIALVFLLALVCFSCKDTPQGTKVEDKDVQEKERPKTRAELWEARTYKRQVTQYGDTLLPYIPQDSVKPFFTRYGLENKETQVRLITDFGNVEMELFNETPLYRASFIYLVKNNYFNGTYIHRVVSDFVVQGGNSDESLPAMMRSSTGNYKLQPNFITSLKHGYGTLSAAKEWDDNPENWHNPFDFFITIRNAGHLDGEHTIFGKVTSGMEVVEEISRVETDESDWPLKDIIIKMEIIQ